MRPWPLLLLVGCAGPLVPADATPYTPQAAYVDLWRRAETCTGRTGDFHHIQWTTVPGRSFDADERMGQWAPPHQITLAVEDTMAQYVIVHEMVHDLMQSAAHGPAFQRCGVP